MFEIRLKTPDDFLKIKETLERVGIANSKDKKLWQSCHILQKGGKYYIVHFKQMFELDGKTCNMTYEDQDRLRDITQLLINWNLCEPIDVFKALQKNEFKVLSHAQRKEWTLIPKYVIGSVKGA